MNRSLLVGLALGCLVGCRSPAAPLPAAANTGGDAGGSSPGVEVRGGGDAAVVERPVEPPAREEEAGAPQVAVEPPDSAPAQPTITSSPRKGMAAPRGSRGKCVVAWHNCACAYECRWVEPGEASGADCANYCGPQPAAELRCSVVDGWCGPVGK